VPYNDLVPFNVLEELKDDLLPLVDVIVPS
jgi:hypothetical protein